MPAVGCSSRKANTGGGLRRVPRPAPRAGRPKLTRKSCSRQGS